MLRVGIVAGEASGDLLAAELIKSLKSRSAEISFEGIGGSRMQNEGCKILVSYEKLAVIGLFEVAGRYLELLGIRNRLKKHFLSNRPDIFIGVDAPDFNLGLEHSMRQHGIKTVHYVSPSVWAWRGYRINKIKNSTDLMLVLFPFEKEIYQKNAIPVEYVGHPLADQIEIHQDKVSIRNDLNLDLDAKIVALMPGSRQSELERILPLQLQAAGICLEKRKDIVFVTSVLSEEAAGKIKDIINALTPAYTGMKLKVFVDRARDVLAAADVGLVTSGTVTLEAMLCGLPMAVAYRINWLSARIIRLMVQVQFAALPNLLAGRQIVREFLQDDCVPEDMAAEIMRLLDSDDRYSIKQIFDEIHQTLKMNASELAADAIIALSQRK